MTERTSKRWWKRPVTLVAGGVLLLVLLLAGAEIWIGIKIRRTIEREAAALTGGICRVEVRHARFNLFNRYPARVAQDRTGTTFRQRHPLGKQQG